MFGWIVLAPLLLAVRGQPAADAFRLGVLFGYASGWAVTWCFAEAAARYFTLPFPVAVLGVSLWYLVVCGVPFGLFAAGSAAIWRSTFGTGRCLRVAALWVAQEFLRGRMAGQPWGLLGYTQHSHPALIQIATATGVYGVSFLMVLAAAALAECVETACEHGRRRPTLPVIALPALLIVSSWGVGGLVLSSTDRDGPGREVAVVQTNVAPALHWTRAYTQHQIAAHEQLTDRLPSDAHPALIVWPENAVPRYLETEPAIAAHLATLAVRHRADLLFGGPRYADGRVYNSARLVTAEGRNGGAYDKQRLVLFAEEKPLRGPSATAPEESPEQFSPGTRPTVLRGFAPLGVSICHEIVHGDLTARSVREGAELLVNVANDGWLDAGYDAARDQHLAMATFRAVETRRDLVRAATSGPSAVIDAYGRVVAALPADQEGMLVVKVLPRRSLTPYVQLGDAFAVGCLLLAAGGLLVQASTRSLEAALVASLAG